MSELLLLPHKTPTQYFFTDKDNQINTTPNLYTDLTVEQIWRVFGDN